MKKIIFTTGLIISSFVSFSQGGVSINNSGTAPNPNSMLDVSSDDKGVLITRLTTVARGTLGTALGLGDNGMLVYDKDLLVFYYWDGTQWVLVGNGIGSDNQNLETAILTGTNLEITIEDGNPVTVDLASLQDGIGTDSQDLSLTGDVLSLTGDGTTVDLAPLKDHDWYEVGGTSQADAITDEIYTNGKVGIGITTPTRELHVRSALTYVSMFESTGNSSGVALPNSSATVSTQAIRSSGNDMQIVNDATTMFHIDGDTPNYGNVGINTTNPTSKLQILNQFAGQNVDTSVYSRYVPQSSLGITHFLASGASTLSASNNIGLHVDFTATNNPNEYGVYIDGESKNYFSNNVGIGTNAPSNKLHVIGGPRPIRAERSGIDAWEWAIDANRMHFVNPGTGGRPITLNKANFVGINNFAPSETLDVIGTFKVVDGTEGLGKVLTSDANGKASWQFIVPAGMVNAFAGATAPSGYLICDGSAVSRATYANLFAVVGTTYGTGNGTTTFNLPDLRGEFIRGFDAGKGTDPTRVFGSNQLASPVVGDDNNVPNDYSMQVAGYSPQYFDNYVPDYSNIFFYYSAGSGAYQIQPSNGGGFLRGSRPRNIAMNYCIKF